MKGTPSALVTHMGGETTSLAVCVKITRKDGTVFGFTEHDRDIPYSGVTYKAATGTSASAIATTIGLNVDNLELTGFLDSAGMTEADIEAGLWDYALVNIFEVNWADLTMGDNKMRRGLLGNVTVENERITAEVRGMIQYLQQTIIETASERCRADLFDTRCKVAATIGTWQFSGCAVSAVSDARHEFTSSSLTQAADFFTNGKVTFTSGANNGLSFEIKLHQAIGSPPASGDITFYAATPYDIAPGDSFTIFAGCQKRYQQDCIAKFANGVNFRGFPFLPGQDQIYLGV